MDKINAVEMVRKIRDKQYLELKGKSTKEIVAYFKRKSKSLKKKLEPAKQSQKP